MDVITRPGPGNQITEAERELIMWRNAKQGARREFDMAQTGIHNAEWIQWKNIEAIQVVKTGATGVLYCSFGKAGSAIVIKSCINPVSVLYSSLILDNLHMFRVPQTRVINASMQEFKDM